MLQYLDHLKSANGILAIILVSAVTVIIYRRSIPASTTAAAATTTTDEEPKSIMQPPKTDLDPPKDTPFTQSELSEYTGTVPGKPIYVAIKGTIFDVTRKADVYGPGQSYNIFAGKDASRGLGMSSLKPEDAVYDYSTLAPADRKTLDDWYTFFEKRYNIIGKVSDLPPLSVPSML